MKYCLLFIIFTKLEFDTGTACRVTVGGAVAFYQEGPRFSVSVCVQYVSVCVCLCVVVCMGVCVCVWWCV